MTNTGTTTTKITTLTGDNIRALNEAQEAGLLPEGTVIAKTTAIFPVSATDAVAAVELAVEHFVQKHGTRRGHPMASLAAPRRKLVKLI